MTKREQGFYDAYNYAMHKGAKTELHEVYGHYSAGKQAGLNHCKWLQNSLNGYEGTIVSHSCYFFTYAFKFRVHGQEWLCYCTHTNDYKFRIDNGD